MFHWGWLFKIKFEWLEKEQGSLQYDLEIAQSDCDVTYMNIHIFFISMCECLIATLSKTQTYARVFTKQWDK